MPANDNDNIDTPNGPTSPDRASYDPDEHVESEVLAAYVDEPERFEPDVRRQVEEHLADCPECRQTLAELETVVRSLRALPDVEPRHSFRLTPEMAGAREPAAFPAPEPWHLRHLDKVRWAAAAAAVLFVVVLTADLAVNRFGPTVTDESSAPAAGQIESDTTAPGEAQDGDSDAPESAADAPAMEMEEEEEAASPATEAPAEADGGDDAAGAEAATETPEASIMGMDPTEAARDRPPTATDGAAATPEAGIMRDSGDEATPAEEALRGADDEESGATVEQLPADAGERQEPSTERQYWRIAEFSLVVLVIVLTAAMLILPRIRRSAR